MVKKNENVNQPAAKQAAGGAAAKKAAARKPGARTAGGQAPGNAASGDLLERQAADVQATVAAFPWNSMKPSEIGLENGMAPATGVSVSAPPDVTGSTLSEANGSGKVGAAPIEPGTNALLGDLTRVRVDGSGHMMTTNQGVAVGDNQNSLKAGLRGPTLLEDFILREKITHFDHERIPERIVHARGSAAHGFFEAYGPMTEFTKAAPFQQAGKITPLFVRFSTVAGERGSTDTARDVRGFAVKFYTDEGNWDLVGNNIPVFFIQDAMKFPDLIHAVKPEPHNAIPQAASAHDTFWDFISLMPESTHMMMWAMSDRALPRSYRMMEGFGVHSFRLVNAEGRSHFVKFHWKPKLGIHSLVWDEALKISGTDPDYHRRDLWDAIESGHYPEWELCFQIFTEEQAEQFSFDVLDSTKLIPEEVVPLTPVGRMVLNRNPDNFFAETEQVAFCTAHVVPGIDFSNDPLLAGRIHSYVDTQISRLGGPNFHEIPINSPIAPVFNNQRDGMHRQAVHRGRVAYEPNSLGGGCPFQAGTKGFVTVAQPVFDDKVRGKPEKFADHYTQATLFYESQTDFEKAHMVGGFRFELSKVTVPAIRERMLASLRNVSDELAGKVAEGLGLELPEPMPRVLPTPAQPEVTIAPTLSMMARPGDGSIETRRIAILAANGTEAKPLAALQRALQEQGATFTVIAPRIGPLQAGDGGPLEALGSLENSAPVLFDAVVLAGGSAGVQVLDGYGHTREFIVNQYRHGKTMLAIGDAKSLLQGNRIPMTLPDGEPDPGVLVADTLGTAEIAAFIAAVGKHRHPVRETDPPRV